MTRWVSIPAGFNAPHHLHESVIATKYTTNYRANHGDSEITINNLGNGAKSLATSVNASLRKLQTDYIDLVSGLLHSDSLIY